MLHRRKFTEVGSVTADFKLTPVDAWDEDGRDRAAWDATAAEDCCLPEDDGCWVATGRRRRAAGVAPPVGGGDAADGDGEEAAKQSRSPPPITNQSQNSPSLRILQKHSQTPPSLE